MSESLHSNSELPKNSQHEVEELAIDSLSRAINERDNDKYEDDDDYDEEYDEDDYYSEYEEQHYGEKRVEFDEDKLTLQEVPLP